MTRSRVSSHDEPPPNVEALHARLRRRRAGKEVFQVKKLSRFTLVLLLISLILITPFSRVYADDLPFVDVKPGSWYYNALCWAYENKYVSGVDDTHFGPNQPCTRAQIVTILYGIAGKPEVHIENPFDDIAPKNYYYNAVLWAVENKITGGVSDHQFGPNQKCTRAQAVTFIWAYFGREPVEPEFRFADVPEGSYYYDAVNWAFSNGVTAGTDWNHFSPKTVVTRAMVVVFLYATKHLIEGEEHDFRFEEDVPATCTTPEGKLCVCACGCKKTIYTGTEVLGHDFCKAKLIADATYTTPTIYQLTCIRCGKADSSGSRSLGKPIFGEPLIQSKIPTHAWTADELANGIHFTSTDGAEATITRRWFANAWCYITHIVLPAGSYSHFTGTNVYAQTGSDTDFIRAYEEMKLIPEAQILVNGDAQLLNKKDTLRGGVPYKTEVYSSTPTWSSITGKFGTIKSVYGLTGKVPFTDLIDLGVTDTMVFGNAYIEDGRLNKSIFDSEPDYSESSYTEKYNRRQVSGIGFRSEGDTVHIYLVACDGCCYINTGATDPYNFANDRASYGNSKRELMILMSTLGVDFELNLDGGWSVCLIIRRNGKIEQVNAADFSLKTGWSAWEARELWDFLYFK